ncbi:MAG TPA: AAA family ATPase, partial [Acidimicrobiales bacterium]|nr:AAA family ATPase [Acidimicrobiales bacterium]
RFRQVVSAARGMGKTTLARHVANRATAELGWLSAVHHCPARGASLAVLAAELSAMIAGEHGLPDRVLPTQAPAGQALASAALASAALAGPAGLSPPQRRPPTGLASAAGCRQRPECACSCRCAHPAGRARVPQRPAPVAAGAQGDLFEVAMLAGRRAAAKGHGILVVVDDCDRLSRADRGALVGLAAELYRAALPVALLAMVSEPGEPLVPAAVDAEAPLWHEALGPMSADESAQALMVPAAGRGVSFSPGALSAMHHFAAGAPLALQKAGFAVWSGTGRSSHIRAAAARDALRAMNEHGELKAS